MKRFHIPPLVTAFAIFSVGMGLFSAIAGPADAPISAAAPTSEPDTLTHLDSITDAYYTDAQWWNDSIDRVIYREMALAFVEVESQGDTTAFNSAENAAGPLQIRPVMVAEANRLLPKDAPKFTLADRWSLEKSIEIFTVVMMNKLIEPDIVAACDVWNPGCSSTYRMAVVTNYLIMEGAEL